MTHRTALFVQAMLAFAGAVILTGCAEGWKASEQEARDWLPGAAPNLKRAIVLLRTCQPRRPSGYNNIWVHGEGGDKAAHCSFGNDTALNELRAVMRDAGVIGVEYSLSGSDKRPVPYASFFLFREGMVTSGSTRSVEYHAESQPCSQFEGREGIWVVRRPLTDAPCRWFWERGEY